MGHLDTSQMPVMARLSWAEARNQELSPGVPCGWQEHISQPLFPSGFALAENWCQEPEMDTEFQYETQVSAPIS